MEKQICPLLSIPVSDGKVAHCTGELCAWYCPGEKVCSVKLVGMELIRCNESQKKA